MRRAAAASRAWRRTWPKEATRVEYSAFRNGGVQIDAGGALPKRCERYEERGSLRAVQRAVNSDSAGAIG